VACGGAYRFTKNYVYWHLLDEIIQLKVVTKKKLQLSDAFYNKQLKMSNKLART